MIFADFDREYPYSLRYQVDSKTDSEQGGPEIADISVKGGPEEVNDIEALIYLLDSPVTLYDESGDKTWWGYVEEVEISRGNVSFGVSLDGMSNRVMVSYSDDTGARGDTLWAQDNDSVSRYGEKEVRYTVSNMDAAAAVLKRDSVLSEFARPSPIASFSRSTNNSEDIITAKIKCAGWWQRMEWRYYENYDGVIESANAEGSGAQNFGEGSGIVAVAQTGPFSGSNRFKHIELPLQKIGDPVIGYPTDSVMVSIKDGTETSTQISTALFSASDIPSDGIKWVKADLVPPIYATGGDPVTVVVQRSNPAGDPDRYYRIQIDETRSYDTASMKVNLSGTWQSGGIPNNGNMCFRLLAPEPTTSQIKSAIVKYANRYFVAVDVLVASDIETVAFSDGDKLLIDEIEKLIDISRKSILPLQATVTQDNRIEITYRSQKLVYIKSDGSIFDELGTPIRASDCKAGFTYRSLDVLPTLEDNYNYSSVTFARASRVEYSANYDSEGNFVSETVNIVPVGARDPFSAELEQG